MMAITWTEYEDRALLPAYSAQVGEVIAVVYHPRREPDRWHIKVYEDEDDSGDFIECTEGHSSGWDTPEEARKYAEQYLI